MANKKPELSFPCERMRLWFLHWTDPDNSATFMNNGGAARAAGYNCKSSKNFSQLGYHIKQKLTPIVNQWLEDSGLSDSALKARLLRLMHAKETKFVNLKGCLINSDEAVRLVAESSQTKIVSNKDDFREYSEEHSVIAIETDNIEVQRRALETALKMKGMLTEQVNVTGLDGLADRIIEARKRGGGGE